MDSDVPGFGVRVSEFGQKSFILIARYPGSPNPTRRALGEYPSLSLGEARERAKDWRGLIRKGIDPKAEEARLKRLEFRAALVKALSETYEQGLEDGLRASRPDA
jgi:hypothetical protein